MIAARGAGTTSPSPPSPSASTTTLASSITSGRLIGTRVVDVDGDGDETAITALPSTLLRRRS